MASAFPITASSSTTLIPNPYAMLSRGNYLTLDVTCQMGNAVESPSHLITMHLGRDTKNEDVSAAFDPSKAFVEFTSKDAPLREDFVLVIKSKDFDKPRCFIESHPTAETSCMMLTLVPRFALNDIPSELIFLVDRIVGFGSSYQFLFPIQSVEYNQTNLAHALNHATSMDADLGATEIHNALQAVFQARRRDMPTQVFVLTDGKVWDVDSVLDLIRQNVGDEDHSEASDNNQYPSSFVRVFSMGIGNNVSHQLVEGMARVGNGFAQFVVQGERMEKKIIRQLKSASMPPMANYKITWVPETTSSTDVDFEMVDASAYNEADSRRKPDTSSTASSADAEESEPKPTISLFSEDPNPTPPPVTPMPEVSGDLQPAPYRVPPLYPGSRFVVHSIVKNSALPQSHGGVPEYVVIRGQTPDGPVELKVPVKKLSNPFSKTITADNVNPNVNIPSQVLLHTPAARKLVQDLEEERSHLHAHLKKNPSLLKPPTHTIHSVVRAEIIRLGVSYNLASKYTSFIAVDEEEGNKEKKRKGNSEEETKHVPPMMIQTQQHDNKQRYASALQQQSLQHQLQLQQQHQPRVQLQQVFAQQYGQHHQHLSTAAAMSQSPLPSSNILLLQQQQQQARALQVVQDAQQAAMVYSQNIAATQGVTHAAAQQQQQSFYFAAAAAMRSPQISSTPSVAAQAQMSPLILQQQQQLQIAEQAGISYSQNAAQAQMAQLQQLQASRFIRRQQLQLQGQQLLGQQQQQQQQQQQRVSSALSVAVAQAPMTLSATAGAPPPPDSAPIAITPSSLQPFGADVHTSAPGSAAGQQHDPWSMQASISFTPQGPPMQMNAAAVAAPALNGPEGILHSLLQLQNWDGSFSLSAHFCSIATPAHTLSAVQLALTDVFNMKATGGQGMLGTLRKKENDEVESIWATCLAVVIFRKKLGALQEECELVMGKAEGFVKGWARIGGKVSVEVVGEMWKKAEEFV
ncbi:hypothetical protein HK102_009253 [Quaeritorhiza haematococci]|nr:hypothetical protein HK102_009253 [Quaeritorhiza haematococci]